MIERQGATQDYRLLGVPLGAKLAMANSDVEPTVDAAGPRLGTGLGLRYYTEFGPLRFDVGLTLNKRHGEGACGVYVSLGEAF